MGCQVYSSSSLQLDNKSAVTVQEYQTGLHVLLKHTGTVAGFKGGGLKKMLSE